MIDSKLFSSKHMIESKIKTKHYKKGQFISDFFDGEYYVGIIEKGEVAVYCISRDGSEVNMSILKAGDIFGIANMFEEEALDTVLKCKTSVRASFYPKKDYIEMMQKDPSITIEYIRYCNKKIQFLLKRIEFLNIQSSKKKIIEHLLDKCDKNDIILLECSKEELSKILRISRASLYRELQLLQNEKCIDFDKNVIKILDKEKLKKYLYEI